MAKQSGIIPIEGTIGNLTFVKTAEGYQVRAKGGVSRQRIMNAPAYARTRENLAEFGMAGKGSKLLRSAFHEEVYQATDSRMTARMTKLLHQALKTDTVNPRGQRGLADADLSILTGFEFNGRSTRETVFAGQVPLVIDKAAGTATLTLAPFIPEQSVKAPQGATHFRIVFAASEVDFATAGFQTGRTQTALQPWDNEELTPTPLTCSIPEDGALPVIAVMGILFYQEVNGAASPLNNGAYNTMSVLRVEQ